jgi:hypothetical protein
MPKTDPCAIPHLESNTSYKGNPPGPNMFPQAHTMRAPPNIRAPPTPTAYTFQIYHFSPDALINTYMRKLTRYELNVNDEINQH